MSRPAKVTLTLREDDARWLLGSVSTDAEWRAGIPISVAERIRDELKHALAECECGGGADA